MKVEAQLHQIQANLNALKNHLMEQKVISTQLLHQAIAAHEANMRLLRNQSFNFTTFKELEFSKAIVLPKYPSKL